MPMDYKEIKLSESEKSELLLAEARLRQKLELLCEEDFQFILKIWWRLETVVRAEMQTREERRNECLGKN